MGASVLVAQRGLLPGSSNGLDEPLIVVAHQRVIPLDHELRVTAGSGQVLDQHGQTCGSGLTVRPVRPGRLIDPYFNLGSNHGGHDAGAVPWPLIDHVQPSIARSDQVPDDSADSGGVSHGDRGEDVPEAAAPALACTKAMALTFVRGLDGSGKSTAARATAFALSAAHPRAKIAVTDSTGRYLFCGGKVVSHRVQHLYKLKPGHDGSALKTGREILAYGLSRRLINSPGHFGVGDAELLISVRDPHRIDPAAYAKIYGWQWLSAMSPQRRLRTLDAVTVSP